MFTRAKNISGRATVNTTDTDPPRSLAYHGVASFNRTGHMN